MSIGIKGEEEEVLGSSARFSSLLSILVLLTSLPPDFSPSLCCQRVADYTTVIPSFPGSSECFQLLLSTVCHMSDVI